MKRIKKSDILLNLTFMILLALMSAGITIAPKGRIDGLSLKDFILFLLYFLSLASAAYFNAFYLTPRYLQRGYRGRFILYLAIEVVCMTLAGVAILSGYFHDEPQGWISNPVISIVNVISSILLVTLVLSSTSAFVLVRASIEERQKAAMLQQLGKATELAALRRQVSPHFIFNMLNNAITLVTIDPKMGQELINSLSSLLHYQIVECSAEMMPLKAEIEHLRQFLNVERVRHDDMDISFKITGDIDNVTIPSLLFLPAVENAVKHNLPDNGSAPYIIIDIEMSDNGVLRFKCSNSKGAKSGRKGGLGIRSMRRRLELMYHDKHSIAIIDDDTEYDIEIIIETK